MLRIIKMLMIVLVIISCKSQARKIQIINKKINPEIAKNFYDKEPNKLYPCLLTQKTNDPKQDSIKIQKLKIYQNRLGKLLKPGIKKDWDIKGKILLYAMAYFNKNGKIEYLAYKFKDEDKMKKNQLKQFDDYLKSIKNSIKKLQTEYKNQNHYKVSMQLIFITDKK